MSRPVRVDPLALSPEAERVFAAFVEELEDASAADIEALCARHPAQADALRAAFEEWRRLDDLLGRIEVRMPAPSEARGVELAASSPLAARLARLVAESGAGDRYEELARIGRGATSEVLRVRDRHLRREVAMKRSLLRLGADGVARRPWGRLSRFLQEAQVLAQLTHPGIPAVHDLGVDGEGRLFLTLPLVEGQDLDALLALHAQGDPRWRLTRVVGVLLAVCEALAYAHSRGVVHRDVKPANVMVGPFGTAMVVDWGLAKLVDVPGAPRLESDRAEALTRAEGGGLVTAEGQLPGTPAYMAPEQAAGDRGRVGPPADVYAVGALLYQLLTGRPPHVEPGTRPSREEVLRRVLRGRPTPVARLCPRCPPELEAICERAMAPDPARRYGRMEELARDLRAWLEGRVVRAYPGGLLAPLKKWVRRNRAVSAALGVGLALGLFGLGYAAWIEQASRARIARLSDVGRLESLVREAERLQPARPELVPRLDGWLAEARALVARRDGYARALEALRARGRPLDDETALPAHPFAADRARAAAEVEAMRRELQDAADELQRAMLSARLERGEALLRATERADDGPRAYAFEEAELRREHDALLALLEGLDALSNRSEELGLLPHMEARRAFAATVARRSLEEPRALWEAVQAELADRARAPRYDGLVLEPQLGLLPLGRDPASGLFEFAHLASGAPPARDADGRLEYSAHSGIVFVLLPGGEFVLGAELPQEAGPGCLRVDPLARTNEGPAARVALAPYFLSKFELTRAQWRRLGGEELGAYRPGEVVGGCVITDLNPVEGLTWSAADALLRAHGLTVPTEAQWERAARAGSAWSCIGAPTLEALARAANLGDGGALDGYPVPTAVGRFAPNAFGLHDMAGNVWEWCADPYWNQMAFARRAGDGLLLADYEGFRVHRGGSYASEPQTGRAGFRQNGCETFGVDVGVRPARPVDP